MFWIFVFVIAAMVVFGRNVLAGVISIVNSLMGNRLTWREAQDRANSWIWCSIAIIVLFAIVASRL